VPLPARPALKPALRQVWRDPVTLQLGLHAGRAVVVAGLGPEDRTLLGLLDGTRDLPALVTEAASVGCPPERTVQLLDLLDAADALDDAVETEPRLLPDLLSLSLLHRGTGAAGRVLARRRAATVAVHGAGRVGAVVAALLGGAGIGRLQVVDDGPVRPADLSPAGIRDHLGDTRAAAATATVRASAPPSHLDTDRSAPPSQGARQRAAHRGGAATAATPAARPTLRVVAPTGSEPKPEVLAATRSGPHLLVAVRETTALVGPLVVPGVTPCLRCLQLARNDRDPGWSWLTAQLAGAPRDVEACDLALATLAAALAATPVLGYVDDPSRRPPSTGGVLEFDLASSRLRRRAVPAHPACGCGAGDEGLTMDP
jgi:bacteriocin biosynthesis cyclodehydratase domain-containing protein